jgi:hypothetical protein
MNENGPLLADFIVPSGDSHTSAVQARPAGFTIVLTFALWVLPGGNVGSGIVITFLGLILDNLAV